MRTPKEFYTFCSHLHQESALVYGPDVRDMIKGALRHVPREGWRILGAYVASLLEGDYSDAQLLAIYHAADPEMGIRAGVRQFFVTLRDEIDRAVR